MHAPEALIINAHATPPLPESGLQTSRKTTNGRQVHTAGLHGEQRKIQTDFADQVNFRDQIRACQQASSCKSIQGLPVKNLSAKKYWHIPKGNLQFHQAIRETSPRSQGKSAKVQQCGYISRRSPSRKLKPRYHPDRELLAGLREDSDQILISSRVNASVHGSIPPALSTGLEFQYIKAEMAPEALSHRGSSLRGGHARPAASSFTEYEWQATRGDRASQFRGPSHKSALHHQKCRTGDKSVVGFLPPGIEMISKPFTLDAALSAKIRELIEEVGAVCQC